MKKKIMALLTALAVGAGMAVPAFAEDAEKVVAENDVMDILIAPAPTMEDTDSPFVDVDENTRFLDAINMVYQMGIMMGVSETEFAPESPLTRAMLVAILHRFAGEPVVNFAMSFTDVADDVYYTEAVRWANANGIVSGTSETEFSPDMNITREQLAAIMYRYMNFSEMNIDLFTEDTNTLSFDDIFDVAEYAAPAMHACLATGIIAERTEGKIAPQADATRAEAANAIVNVFNVAQILTSIEEESKIITTEYQDSNSQRATLTYSVMPDETNHIMVSWADSADKLTVWEMNVTADGSKLSYTDCEKTELTFDEDGNVKDEKVVYENGKGYFTIDKDSKLLWNGASDKECKKCVFEIVEPVEETEEENETEELVEVEDSETLEETEEEEEIEEIEEEDTAGSDFE